MDENALMNIVTHERNLQLFCFLGVFALMSLWEWKASRRGQRIPKKERWPHNLVLAALNTLIIRVLFPGASLWAAYWAYSRQFGLFHKVEVPLAFSIIFTIIFLDWVVYYLHRAFHAVPLLWKIHRMHHTDLEVDVTTGTRFHPFEAVVSTLVKSAAIILLGPPVFGVFFFEVIFDAVTMFNHSNAKLPKALDTALRFLVVTPDMHRIHHSTLPVETNRNFGFIFPWWDRLLRTYKAEPEKGQVGMTLGLDIFNKPEDLKVDRLLMQPFLDKDGRFNFNNLTQKER